MIRVIFKTILILSMLLFISGTVDAETSDLGTLFSKRNLKGTIVISSLDGKTEYIYNHKRAAKRLLPASTFKIPNTLIALDERAIEDEKKIIKWDGKVRDMPAWNKDHSLETAFPVSCVWFYQELAKRVGKAKYLSHLKKLNYGNKMTGPDISLFWLNGDIKISAKEQITLLKKLYHNKLPYKKNHLEILKKIMIVDKTADYIIRAKPGWAERAGHQHGWYVGYVEVGAQVWFFAMNIVLKSNSDLVFRKELTMEALKLKGII